MRQVAVMARAVILMVGLCAVAAFGALGSALRAGIAVHAAAASEKRAPSVGSRSEAGVLSTLSKTRTVAKSLKRIPHLSRRLRRKVARTVVRDGSGSHIEVRRHETLGRTLSSWFFKDGLPLADHGFPFDEAGFVAAQNAWRFTNGMDELSAAIRTTQNASLKTGRRTIAYVDDRLRQLERSGPFVNAEVRELRSITLEALRDFDLALARETLSKNDVHRLAQVYLRAVDLERPMLMKPRNGRFLSHEMPFFSATKAHWRYRQLYQWLGSDVMPRELPHPMKRYDGVRGSAFHYKLHDDAHLDRVETALGGFPHAETRTDLHTLRDYVENIADPTKREKARVVYALRLWEGRKVANRMLEQGLADKLDLHEGVRVVEELEGWVAKPW